MHMPMHSIVGERVNQDRPGSALDELKICVTVSDAATSPAWCSCCPRRKGATDLECVTILSCSIKMLIVFLTKLGMLKQTHIHVRILAPTTATTQHFVSAHDGDYYSIHVVAYCTRLWKLLADIDALLDDSCISYKLFLYSTQCSLPLTKPPVTILPVSPMSAIYILASSCGTRMWRPVHFAFLTVRRKRSIDNIAILICSCSSTACDCNAKCQRSHLQQHITDTKHTTNVNVFSVHVHVRDCITKHI